MAKLSEASAHGVGSLRLVEAEQVEQISLRGAGYNEKWLQDYLANHPEVLGFGEDVECRDKERMEPKGGRLDLLFENREIATRYCVEVMLGDVDESHIIRTIEYWDHERSRYSNYEHVAVLIAEGVTHRFLNVITLIARFIPLVVIQMNATRIREQFILNFTTILNQAEEPITAESSGVWEKSTRPDWEKKATAESLATFDAWLALAEEVQKDLRVTYNRGHIAIGGASTDNFSWIHPRKNNKWVRAEIYIPESELKKWEKKLNDVDIETNQTARGKLRFNLTKSEISKHKELLRQIIEISLQSRD